ncbi:MAG: hypothetical protein GY730_10040, partial [bacterium]|nr:hypothetical protein [bacterium]
MYKSLKKNIDSCIFSHTTNNSFPKAGKKTAAIAFLAIIILIYPYNKTYCNLVKRAHKTTMNNWKQSYKRPERHKIYQDAIEEYERTWKQYGRHCTLEQHRSLKACYSKIVETFRTFKDSPLSPALTKKFKADKSTSVKPGKFKAF